MQNNLVNEIARALEDYSDEVTENLDQAKDEISKEAVSALKATSPNRSGDYAKNWSRKKTKYGWIVFNKDPTYRLTHLLEFGHMMRNGGRTKAIPHIEPVEQSVIEKFTSAAEKAVTK